MINSITTTTDAIKDFQVAIQSLKKALSSEIENDKEFIDFKDKWREKNNFSFIFFESSLDFEFYHFNNGMNTTFFKINQRGEIVYDENNSFEGMEEVAITAQKIVQKFL